MSPSHSLYSSPYIGEEAKIEEMVTVSNIKDGNLSSETNIKIDKKDKNALHYLMGYE